MNISPWEKVKLARMLFGPRTRLYRQDFEDFIELHGDRFYSEDRL